MISLLARSGASTAAVARRGYTPLHSACMRGRWRAARALLAFGADANAGAEDQVCVCFSTKIVLPCRV